jgi:cytochrome P450
MAEKVEKKQKLAKRILTYLLREKPDQFFCFLRNTRPNLNIPKGPAIITRFRDVQEVLSRPETFNVTYKPMMDPSVGPFMLARDGDTINQRDKGIMRALIQQEDLPYVGRLVTKLANKAIDETQKDGLLEVVANLSRRVPVQLTGQYFGFPGPDEDTMFRWSRTTQNDMFHNQDKDPQIHADNVQSGTEMKAWLKEYLPKRQAELAKDSNNQDDIVARLLQSSCPHAIDFNEDRLRTNIMGLLVGGVETTSQVIVQILDQFFNRPDVLRGAREAAENNDDSLLFQYCWEALRFNPINPFVVRYCVKDYRVAAGTLRAATIKAGTVVLVSTRSAMRDGRELKRASSFRTDRPRYHYMHLGYGLHTCLGDQVSEVQVPMVIKALLLKKNLRRATGSAGQIDFKRGPFPESFSVQFD